MADGDFLFLRPYCILVLEQPTRTSVEALVNALRKVDKDTLQQIQEYVLLPLSQLIYATDRSREVVVDAICCIKEVVSLTKVISWNVFVDIAFQVVRTISNVEKDNASPVASAASDELKQAVVSCLMMLVDKSIDSILEQFYGDQFLPRMGHIIYLLLHLSEHETCRETRLISMECLKMLGKGLTITKIRSKAKNCLASFIPGISVNLTKVATESGLSGQLWYVAAMFHQCFFFVIEDFMTHFDKQNFQISQSALKVWIALIFEVFDDEQYDSGELDNLKDKTDKQSEASSLKVQRRTEEWVKISSEKIVILSQKMSILEGHSNWNVRCALAEWAGRLLHKCKRSLSDSVPLCIGILITLSSDDYPDIMQISQRQLLDFNSKLSPNERSLMETLQENLLELIMQLPTIFRHSGDAKKLSTLDKLNGYFNTLGPSLNIVLNSASHLEKLSFGLLHLSEMDYRNVPLICEKAICVDANPIDEFIINPPPKIRKQFLHFNDERIHLRIIHICQTLGKFGSLALLVDHFIERFHESSIYRKQALLLLNGIISGVSFQLNDSLEDGEDVYSIIHYVIDEYTDASVWDLKVSIDSDKFAEFEAKRLGSENCLVVTKTSDDESSNVLSSNALQTCLLLEGIGNCAQVLGERFNPILMPVLYNVLEKLGSANALVSHSAYSTLLQITNSCKYSSISDLILKNADYLLNSLSIKLKYNPHDPKGPVVLRVTLEQCDKEMLDLSKDIVDELLKNLDTDQVFNLTLYLSVLLTLVNAILKWFPSKKKNNFSCHSSSDENKLSVNEFIMEYHTAKVKTEQLFKDEDETMDSETLNSAYDNNASKPDKDQKQKSPAHVEMTVKILERCSHLLPSKSQMQVLLTLEIVNVSAVILQDWEDDLLPMVHRIWAPLSKRFSQDNLVVTKMAFASLCTLATVCGDFVRKDVLKDIWPKILLFLDKQQLLSLNREGTAYQYTAGYKLLLHVLENIGKLVDMLEISDLELDNLASVLVLYLSSQQPVDVQKAALTLFEQLLTMNPDLIWLKLVDVYCDSCHLSVSLDNLEFRPIKVYGQNNSNAEFKKNVATLLETMDKSEKRLGFE